MVECIFEKERKKRNKKMWKIIIYKLIIEIVVQFFKSLINKTLALNSSVTKYRKRKIKMKNK
jgi:hypothetical protein